MDLLYLVLEFICENSDDYELYLKICLISKYASSVAKSRFKKFNFSHSKASIKSIGFLFIFQFKRTYLIDLVCSKWKEIEELDLSYTQITNDIFTIIHKKMHKLKKINVSGCHITDDVSLLLRPFLLDKTQNLKNFVMCDCVNITETFFTMLAATPVQSKDSFSFIGYFLLYFFFFIFFGI
jgi:hypothetical protein